MKCRLIALALFAVTVASCSVAAEPAFEPGHLILPAQDVSVDLKSGVVTRKKVSGQCLETVSNSGPFQLIVRRKAGDDVPDVTINGARQNWVAEAAGPARLGAVRLARDGSMVLLRTWKTGQKQTELLQDGRIVHQWKRGSSPKLLKFTEDAVLILESQSGHSWHLNLYPRHQDGRIEARSRTLVDFGNCQPGRLRIAGNVLWAQLDCGKGRQNGVYRINLETGDIGSPVLVSPAAEFAAVPKAAVPANGQTVAVVSGTPAALQFYYAVTGLLLSQPGEVRACASDAEGSQSWNQSYRLRSLATLFEETGSELFAALALKSMRLTLAAQDGKHGRAGPSTPACGWSSTIYGQNPDERLSLMINQAMIGNSLASSCRKLGKFCPISVSQDIEASNKCLALGFEEDFDEQAGIYRIGSDVDFRFAGNYAPWNWQIAFAALLAELPDAGQRTRAQHIVRTFLNEWQTDDNGGLWRYWPRAYYSEKGVAPAQIEDQRFEDTGHAGITLLSLSDFTAGGSAETTELVRKRLDYLLSFGDETSRDLNGDGPKGHRWFPAGGWSHFASKEFTRVYGAPVPGRYSADTLYAYARLFDPSADFHLSLEILTCTKTCLKEVRREYSSWQSFLSDNPFFKVSETNSVDRRERNREVRNNQSKIHNP
ncbi:hypothetical protein [uncultured Roseibium sp.]|uniref:hypothetical protein n=1 Tax=uncultured Roseibium sp. TaxID=1936171 RepID=UPI00263259F6|nr:hypothetical protein [uncultured Roseibium sp.]